MHVTIWEFLGIWTLALICTIPFAALINLEEIIGWIRRRRDGKK